jgi:hypothetical protein
MFQSIILLLFSHLFSFMLGHLHKSCRAEHEDHFILYQLCLIPSLSCSNWGIKLLFLLKHGKMFHVLASCFKEAAEQLATSSLPPTARPMPCPRTWPHNSWPLPSQTRADCLGVSSDLSSLLLSTKAPLCSSPSTRRHRRCEELELDLSSLLNLYPIHLAIMLATTPRSDWTH